MSARRRLGEEEGISLVAAIVSLGLLLMLSATVMQQGVLALRGSTHEARVKRATQAADAAIDAAVFRLNRADLGGALNIDPLNPGNVLHQTCVVTVGDPAALDLTDLPVGAPLDPQGRRWCPATAPESAGSNATFEYRVSQLARVASGDCGGQGTLELDREIVAIGRSGDVVRRVKARMRASLALLSGAAVQSASATAPMRMTGAARVLGAVQSNHDIVGSPTNVIAGNAIPGPGAPPHTVSGVIPVGSSTAACQRFVLPAVDQADAPTSNDNPATLPQRCLTTGLLATPCTVPLLGTTGGVEWDAGRRTLRVWGNGVVTLPADTYSLCSLRLEGQAILQIPSSSPVTRIFMDAPENCSGVTGAGQLSVDGNARLVNCHLQTQPHTLQVYAVGSQTAATTQTVAGAAPLGAALLAALCGVNLPAVGTPMMLYAPRSTVVLGGSAALSGQVAGNTVQMSGTSAVEPVNALINLNKLGANPVLPLYQPTQYVQCRGAGDFDALPVEDPAQGC